MRSQNHNLEPARAISERIASRMHAASIGSKTEAEACARMAGIIMPEIKKIMDDNDQYLRDLRAITRLIDVAMHGSAGASKDGRIADLVKPATDLRGCVMDCVSVLRGFYWIGDKAVVVPDRAAVQKALNKALDFQ
jgi:hypothetical protein